MKLLQQTGFYFLGFSTIVLILGSIGVFVGLRYTLDHEMDESLHHTRSVLFKELSKRDSLTGTLEIMDEIIDLKPVSALSNIEIFQDTLRWVEELGEDQKLELELEPYRQYIYTERIKGQNYRIALSHSKFESEDLFKAMVGLIVGFLAIFLLLLNVFNRYLSQRIWQPFYQTINQIQDFDFKQIRIFTPAPTRIEEFKTLNLAIWQMMDKVAKDYHSLKQFTENASHEIQTPLAIIRSQVELLLQEDNRPEKDLQRLVQIQRATSKMTKLNQALLLLTRIENNQYHERETINLAEVIQQKLDALEPLIENKELQIIEQLNTVALSLHPALADILINNLLSNAIRHNQIGGQIKIEINADHLQVSNTGKPLTIPVEQIFERFRKNDDAATSLGLGLAIVKEIVHLYGWRMDYENTEDWHVISILF